MVKCPSCKRELNQRRNWSYALFKVEDYACDCGTRFRRYVRDGKHVFTLKLTKDGKWRKDESV